MPASSGAHVAAGTGVERSGGLEAGAGMVATTLEMGRRKSLSSKQLQKRKDAAISASGSTPVWGAPIATEGAGWVHWKRDGKNGKQDGRSSSQARLVQVVLKPHPWTGL